MFTVMVTGGLGSGKSTLVELLRAKGALTLDLDDVSHALLSDCPPYIEELAERFGSGILDDEGAVVPARLAQRAFASAEDCAALNAISFPYIEQRVSDYVLDVHCTPRADARVLVLEVALLAEAPQLAALADAVIAVVVAPELRLRRAIARGMQPQDALSRMQLQASDAERAALAGAVCENDGTLEQLSAWAEAWWDATVPAASAGHEGRG